ncbi:MAG: hypothetical protein WA374_17160 [Acidobacteriaceae bacterium]
MWRGLLACVGLVACCAPALSGQTKVCAFQDKPGHAANVSDSDADALARELNSHSIETVAAVGVSKKDEDAEAQKRGCTWIVTLWRQAESPDSPVFAGSLGAARGGDAQTIGEINSTGTGGAILNFKLQKIGSRKDAAHGYSEDASPYAKMADQIMKKVDSGK